MTLTPKEIIEYLRDIESDISKATNDGKSSEKAYKRIIDRALIASNMLESLTEQE